MLSAVLTCGACDAPIPYEAINGASPVPCRRCGAHLEAAVFPALFSEIRPGTPGERVLFDDESSCFYHTARKAVVPCDICGRFLCALCDIELNGQHLCPSCIDAGKNKGKMEELENQRTRYDRLALALAMLPALLITMYFTIFTAPAALFVTLRYWKAPLSPVRPWRWRFVLAFLLGVMEISAIGLFITMIVLEAIA